MAKISLQGPTQPPVEAQNVPFSESAMYDQVQFNTIQQTSYPKASLGFPSCQSLNQSQSICLSQWDHLLACWMDVGFSVCTNCWKGCFLSGAVAMCVFNLLNFCGMLMTDRKRETERKKEIWTHVQKAERERAVLSAVTNRAPHWLASSNMQLLAKGSTG